MTNNSNTPETDFANDAGAGGMMEVELGQLAEKNGSSPAVKNFGKMMVTDHSKLNDELKDLAAKKNITLPTSVTSDQQNDIDKLTKETGKDFDKDYVSMMVDDHKKDIDAFEKAQDKITDTDFKVFITKALPVLHKHLNAIEQIKKHM
jgi:putative membrane protein